jgi:hypothetical protein
MTMSPNHALHLTVAVPIALGIADRAFRRPGRRSWVISYQHMPDLETSVLDFVAVKGNVMNRVSKIAISPATPKLYTCPAPRTLELTTDNGPLTTLGTILEHPRKNLEHSKQSWNRNRIYQTLTAISTWNKTHLCRAWNYPGQKRPIPDVLCLCVSVVNLPLCRLYILRSSSVASPILSRFAGGGGCLCW